MSTETVIQLQADQFSGAMNRVVRAECARRDVTGKELARRLGISQQSVSDRWRGKTPWSLDDVQRVEVALGVAPMTLLEELVRHQGLEPRTR